MIEKLVGACVYCNAPHDAVSTETVHLHLNFSGAITPRTRLHHWRTNETSWFTRQADLAVSAQGRVSTASVVVPRDSIVTVSTILNASHGAPPARLPHGHANGAFPLPYADDFEGRTIGSFPRYLADNGGSFEIAPDPLPSGGGGGSGSGGVGHGQVLKQAVAKLASGNAWTQNVAPVSVIGDGNWTDLAATVDVLLVAANTTQPVPQPMYAGLCQRAVGGGGQMRSTASQALCLTVYVLLSVARPSQH